MNQLYIYFDWDGTCVEFAFPYIGADNPGAIQVLEKLYDKGHLLILNSTRINIAANFVDDVRIYLRNKSVKFEYSIAPHKIRPKNWDLDQALKPGFIFIDDEAEGMPLIKAKNSNSYMVDWGKVEEQLQDKGII